MKTCRLGLSWYGLAAVALVMLPNLLYLFFTPPNNPLAANSASFFLWDLLENIGRFGVMAALVFLQTEKRGSRWMAGVAIALLAAYYTLWVAYFLGITPGIALLGLAVFPTGFFLVASLWLKNYISLGFAALFGAAHIAITAGNYLW